MSVRSTAFVPRTANPLAPPLPHMAHETGKTTEVAPAQSSAAPPSGMDVILFWGPGQLQSNLDAIRKACADAGLTFKPVIVDGRGSFSGELKNALYPGGELGSNTQVIASFHGAGMRYTAGHEIQVTADGAGFLPTVEFMSWLRTPPPGMPAGWRGQVHFFSCRAKTLLDFFRPRSRAWACGTVFTYASRKDTPTHGSMAAILDLCGFLGSVKDAPELLVPVSLAARMLGVVGDTFACMGAGLEQPLVVGAPRSPAEVHPAFLPGVLGAGTAHAHRISGSERDLNALAAALACPRIGAQDPQRHKVKLESVYITRYHRDKVSEMDALLAQHGFLADITERDGISGREMRERAAAIVFVKERLKLLRSGRGNPHTFITVLEKLAALATAGISFAGDLASALVGRPGILKAGMQWAVVNSHVQVFFHLLAVRKDCPDDEVVADFLPLALEHCAVLAMRFLHLEYPRAGVPELIAAGIRLGASRKVLWLWLQEPHWRRNADTIRQVLRQALEAGFLPFVLRRLAKGDSMVFDQVLDALSQDQHRYAQAAWRLLEHAQASGDAALADRICRRFDGAGRHRPGPAAPPAPNRPRARSMDN